MKNSTLLLTLLLLACTQTEVQDNQSESLYNEPFRPQYHFTPPSQWMNDPNGMVFYEGEYHLFYQHFPDSNVWGPMHWGHAVSADMITWEHLPIALYPDSLGYIFSGSAVIDWKNTSGLGSTENPAMVAIYTYHKDGEYEKGNIDFQTQGIAYSLDKGRSWTKYDENPVLPNPGIIDFRDPKVFWYEEDQKWVMILAVKDRIYLYSSQDLKAWDFESEFGNGVGSHVGVWECPDLFPLDDENGDEHWVMLVSVTKGGPQGGSATQYFVGGFDGSRFIPHDTLTRWIDLGADNYAGVTWSDIPEDDGRRLFIGWMSNWQYANIVPTYEWRSAMTLPRELIINKTENDFILQSKPVAELQAYVAQVNSGEGQAERYTLPAGEVLIEINDVPDSDFSVTISNDANEKVVIRLGKEQITVDRSQSGITDFHEDFGATHDYNNFLGAIDQVQIFLDRSSIELFVNDGKFVMTDLIFPNQPYTQVFVEQDQVKLAIYKISSIWEGSEPSI